MAYDPTTNTQFDGTKKLIYVFNIDASKDGSTGTTVIDVSALAKSQRNQACNRISLNKIWYNISVTSPFDGVKLQWENTGGDETFLTLVGYDSWDFSNIGGLVNPNTGVNSNGDVNIVIPAHTAGDTFSVVFEFLKYYEF